MAKPDFWKRLGLKRAAIIADLIIPLMLYYALTHHMTILAYSLLSLSVLIRVMLATRNE